MVFYHQISHLISCIGLLESPCRVFPRIEEVEKKKTFLTSIDRELLYYHNEHPDAGCSLFIFRKNLLLFGARIHCPFLSPPLEIRLFSGSSLSERMLQQKVLDLLAFARDIPLPIHCPLVVGDQGLQLFFGRFPEGQSSFEQDRVLPLQCFSHLDVLLRPFRHPFSGVDIVLTYHRLVWLWLWDYLTDKEKQPREPQQETKTENDLKRLMSRFFEIIIHSVFSFSKS